MQKFFSIIIISILIVGGLAFILKNKIGDIRPAILPPAERSISSESQGDGDISQQNLPININSDPRVSIFAKELGAPRDLEFSPGGILLVSVPSKGRIVSLPEAKNILTGLDKPHGIAFYNGRLYVAEEGKVVRYNWNETTHDASLDKVLFSLPSGGRHFTRTIAFNSLGQMFVSIGSTCDVCIEKHPFLAAVIVSDSDGKSPALFAKGLRNSVFITVNPSSDELWGTEMGRDFLGDNLPPDEINIIRDGADYGWPTCFGNKVKDTKFEAGSRVSPCEATESPVFEIAAHSAPLGLAFYKNHLYVAYHGSWNRSTLIGYKIVRFDVNGNSISNEQDFITGFLNGSEAIGRPVDIIFDKEGNMFLSDDKAGVVYKVSK